MKKKLYWLLEIIFIISFIVVMKLVLDNKITNVDIKFYHFIYDNLNCHFLITFCKIITNLSSTIFISILIILAFFILKKEALLLIFSVLPVTILNMIIKYLVGRERPNILPLINVKSYSFTSGHSLASIAFYGFLIYLINKKIKNNKLRISLISILIFLIFLIGFSRLYLGVHYLSDVIGGYLLGISYLLIYLFIIESLQKKKNNR